MNTFIKVLPIFIGIFSCTLAQGILKGVVKDAYNHRVIHAQMIILETQDTTYSDSSGTFSFQLPAGIYHLRILHPRYAPQTRTVKIEDKHTTTLYVNLQLPIVELKEQVIEGAPKPTETQVVPFMETLPLSVEQLRQMPMPKSDIESILSLLPGVALASEFSSQYRVRGGSYDENLVYVNGIEIFRPQLIRTGKQEGLGFSNPYLADEVYFSSGGFGVQYGDKLSSVLAIHYREPSRNRATLEAGLLTLNFHIENYWQKNDSAPRFSYQLGIRRFTTRPLLKTLNTTGTYRPSFWDGQLLLRFQPHSQSKWKIEWFTVATQNTYDFEPESQVTTFGMFPYPIRLFVAYAGRERSQYQIFQTAVQLYWNPNYRWQLRGYVSYYVDQEKEFADIEGAYRLADVNPNFAAEDFNEVIFVRGVGSQLEHRRNWLFASVQDYALHGKYAIDKAFKHFLHFGIQSQQRFFWDRYTEWYLEDSSDFVFPVERVRTTNTFSAQLHTGYLQHLWWLTTTWKVQWGIRSGYWNANQSLFITPRIQVVWDPSKQDSTRPFQLRAAWGMYFQPPFYREMRDFDGKLYPEIPLQKAIHYILGGDYLFYAWERPFKLTAELYYKQLWDLIPYEFQNVRIRYYPTHRAKGYVRGIDVRLNGQFIQGLDSWLSVTVMETREQVQGFDRYVYRPTDQRLQVNFYFQDYLPNNPTFRVHIQYIYQTGLPFGPPRILQNRTAFRMSSYQRVDLGLSKLIIIKEGKQRKHWHVRQLWLGLDVFNLLDRQNEVSYQWVKDVFNTRFAVPNYLTGRLLNVRVIAYL